MSKLILAGWLLTFSYFASAAEPAATTIKRPFFYRVTIQNKTSYILGTIHIGVDLEELPDYVMAAFKSSRLLLAELVASEEDLNDWLYNPTRAIINESKKYKIQGEPLSEEDRALLRDKWKLPEPLIDIARSSSCGVFSSIHFPSTHQMDLQMMKLAHQIHLGMQALDTTELREEADAAQDAKDGLCDIRPGLRSSSPEEVKARLAQLIEAYRDGNESDWLDDSEDVKIRNKAWMSTILTEVEKGGVFIDVGVAHLFGPVGLITLLKNAGAQVERQN